MNLTAENLGQSEFEPDESEEAETRVRVDPHGKINVATFAVLTPRR